MAATTTARRNRKPAAQPESAVAETPATAPVAPEVTPSGTETTAVVSIKQRAAKAPTQLHRDFAAWLQAQTGHQVDPKTVQLTISLLGDYQKSPERKAARVWAAEQREGALAERKAAVEKKAAERKAKLEKQLAAIQVKLGE